MVCSWQFPLVSGLLQMTVEEEEREERKREEVFSFHAFPLLLEETAALPVLMRPDSGPQMTRFSVSLWSGSISAR